MAVCGRVNLCFLEGSFEEFIYAVLALPVADRVRTFSLICKHVALPVDYEDHLSRYLRHVAQYEDHIGRCLRHLVVKRGVVALNIKLAGGVNYSLPSEVFTCKTVSTMKLGSGFVIDALPGDVFLPTLKSLYLNSVRFYASNGRCSFQTLLSASPLLEELFIDGLEWESWKWCCMVSSTTLRRLTIRRREWVPEFEGIYVGGISFDTPAINYLYYSDFVRTEYPIVNLNSLVETSLDCLQPRFDDEWWDDLSDVYNPMNLINGIQNVEILEVDATTIDMFYVFHKVLPVFKKLHQLSVNLYDECWINLPNLIEKCPNLKSLIIMDSLHTGRKDDGIICTCVSEYSFLSPSHSSSLEVLKIKGYRGTAKEMKQMKLLLEKAASFKLVKVHAQVPSDKKLKVMADLVMLPRASASCVIEVKFK